MLSIPHLIIVFIVALVVFGPEKLPELARNVGKVLAEFKRASGDFRSTFEDHMRELEREADSRKIAKPAEAAAGSAAPSGAVPATPPYLSATAVEESGEQAPWEKAVETAAAGAEISAEPPLVAETVPDHPEGIPHNSETGQETPIDGNFTT